MTLGYDTVSDTVRGSEQDYPYIERVFTITGLDQAGHNAKLKRLKRRLERRKEDLQDKRLEIDEFIGEIDDSLTRQIITLRYVNGLTWGQVAAHIGGGNTADGVRKQCHRYLDNM